MEAIEPASFAQHEALALLMGRPIAVVRARVDLQLMGQPTHLDTLTIRRMPGEQSDSVEEIAILESFRQIRIGQCSLTIGDCYYGCSYEM